MADNCMSAIPSPLSNSSFWKEKKGNRKLDTHGTYLARSRTTYNRFSRYRTWLFAPWRNLEIVWSNSSLVGNQASASRRRSPDTGVRTWRARKSMSSYTYHGCPGTACSPVGRYDLILVPLRWCVGQHHNVARSSRDPFYCPCCVDSGTGTAMKQGSIVRNQWTQSRNKKCSPSDPSSLRWWRGSPPEYPNVPCLWLGRDSTPVHCLWLCSSANPGLEQSVQQSMVARIVVEQEPQLSRDRGMMGSLADSALAGTWWRGMTGVMCWWRCLRLNWFQFWIHLT